MTKAFSVPTTIPALTARFSVVTGTLRTPAHADDLLAEIFDSEGNGLGLEDGDLISFSGFVGDEREENETATTYAAGAITLQNLLDRIRANSRLPERDGSIEIRGQPENAFDIRALSIRATDPNNARPSPHFFNTNLNVTSLRSATDTRIPECNLDVFDGTGMPHRIILRFIPMTSPDQWLWEAQPVDAAKLLRGTRGTARFGEDGSLSAFLTEEGDARMEFDLGRTPECHRPDQARRPGIPYRRGLQAGLHNLPGLAEVTGELSRRRDGPDARG